LARILYVKLILAILFLLNGCGSDRTFNRTEDKNFVLIKGKAETVSFVNLTKAKMSPLRAPLSYAAVTICLNNQKYVTETNAEGVFTAYLPSDEVMKVIIITASKNNISYEKQIITSEKTIDVTIDNTAALKNYIQKTYRDYYSLPEDYSGGFNPVVFSSGALAAAAENDKNYIVNSIDYYYASKNYSARNLYLNSGNEVVWTYPYSTLKPQAIGCNPAITICFSTPVNTNQSWREWLHFSPDTFIINTPRFVWNKQGDKILFYLNSSDRFPDSANITVSIDSNLKTLSGSAIQPYTWTFTTGYKYLVNTREYMFFPENYKYLFYRSKAYYPFAEFMKSYTPSAKTYYDTGCVFDFYGNSLNYIKFLLNDKGLYILKYSEEMSTIEFPTPILLLPYYAEYDKYYETDYETLTYKTKISALGDKSSEVEYLRNIDVSIELPPSAHNNLAQLTISFGWHYGISKISSASPGITPAYVKHRLTYLKGVFPAENTSISQKNAAFVFERIEYPAIYYTEISKSPDFSSVFTYFEQALNKTSGRIILNEDTYYYRTAAKYADFENRVNTGVFSPVKKIFAKSDTAAIVSTPPKLAFLSKNYYYQPSAVTISNNRNFIYYLSKYNYNMRMNPYTGLLIWPVSGNSGDTFIVEYSAANLDFAEIISDSYVLKIYSNEILALWENAAYKFSFYSDCSMKLYNKTQSQEFNGSYDISGANIIFYNATSNDTEYLTNFNISGNNMFFYYKNENLTLSKNGVLN